MKIDLTGQRFGRLAVTGAIKRMPKGKYFVNHWECICDCGKTAYVRQDCLTSGNSKSCGCVAAEKSKARAIHGQWNSRQYKVWTSMVQRCTNPKDKGYPEYGGRGITVCERWRSYKNFLEDMGQRPKGGTIDRIDNNGNYEPGNCRWATQSEQNRNTRRHRNNSSGVTGVDFDKSRRKYRAQFRVDGRNIMLGRFDTVEEAAEARREAEIQYWGHERVNYEDRTNEA